MKPQEWGEVVIGELCETIIDCVNKTAPVVDFPTPYKMIRTTNVRDGWISLHSVKYVDHATYLLWTRRQTPKKGDVILTREAPLGEVGMLRSDDKVFLGQRLVSYRVNPKKLDNRFLLYAFQGDCLRAQIKALGSGSTVEHMRVPDAKNLKVFLPPLASQKKIGSILAAYDDLIENNTRRIEILEEMARRLYEEWFVQFRFPGHEGVEFKESELGLIPGGWLVTELEEVVRLTMGQSPSSEFYNEVGKGLPFHQGVTGFGDYFPSNKTYCAIEARVANEGDILFSVRAPVGRINIATEKIVIGRGVSALRSKTDHQIFLLSQLRCIFKEEDSMGNGAIFKAVTKKDMQSIKLLQPFDEIIERFELIAAPLWRQIRILSDKNTNLSKQRDLLLPKLISGEIDVSDIPMPT
ncbi:restriction endonuclease subunit S [Halopseudomonas aestusnigri]|uniref:restriction endonuclease subunit S n=1 Tax=Halopseudomonas aestusnigri TaxID=857252 RepID=UPI0025557021|nr:restriction endonuclease subunit S [Halopseudomonas aestusnigri]MDL2200630.1 restriction endonuclease subunit S [Halopseudomonas aestusnigri]